MNELFEVRIERDDFFQNDILIHVTHNGYQWTTLWAHGQEELDVLIEALQKFVRKEKKDES